MTLWLDPNILQEQFIEELLALVPFLLKTLPEVLYEQFVYLCTPQKLFSLFERNQKLLQEDLLVLQEFSPLLFLTVFYLTLSLSVN